MEALIIDTIIEKVNANVTRLDEQEKIISEISQKVLVTTTTKVEAIKNVVDAINIIRKNINSIQWPVKEMTEMSNRLAENNELLSNPRENETGNFSHRRQITMGSNCIIIRNSFPDYGVG